MSRPTKLGYVQVTQAATAIVRNVPTGLFGIVVVASTGGTITIYDNATAASGVLLFAKDSLAKGETIHFGGLGIAANNGLFVTLGGTCTANILYL